MAGDWIKMRVCLQKSPQVIRLAGDLNRSKNEILGTLFALWCLADEHSQDGVIKFGIRHLDAELGIAGFSEALISVGWLEPTGENSIRLVNFEEHNGQTARKRAADYGRIKATRAQAKQTISAQKEIITGLEKRREDESKIREEKNTPEESEKAAELARLWMFYRRGVCASEAPGKVLEHFTEALKHGLDYDLALAEIERPGRKRTQYLWQFMVNVEPNKSTTVEGVIERMMKSDPELLGVAFNE